MRRTTISLPDDVAAALEREARRRRVSVSQVAREAIEAELGLDEEARNPWPFTGLWESAEPVTAAAELEGWLAGRWAKDIEDDAFARDR